MTAKAFASQADLQDKRVSFTRLSEHAYPYTAEGADAGQARGEAFARPLVNSGRLSTPKPPTVFSPSATTRGRARSTELRRCLS
jgi:hypothetical protein